MLFQILWDPSISLFKLGSFEVRYYGLMWVIGIALAYLVVQRLYKAEKIGDEKFEPLFFYCFIGILLGARIGHCLLYQPWFYLTHPVEMLLPIKMLPEGGWKMTGYTGLASHGGSLGIILAIWLYVKKYKVKLFCVLDLVAIATPLTAGFIRLGNLMNSEIVGKATQAAWGFVFVQNNENFARYPAQLMEAIYYFLLFPLLWWLYRKHSQKVGTGFFFGYLLIAVFSFRFCIEFIKEVQEPWELQMQQLIGLNQGQLLSLPFVVLGLYCLRRAFK